MRSPRRSMCAAILVLEAVTLGLTAPVLIVIAEVPVAAGLTVGLGLAVACVLVAGLLRRPWAYAGGYLVQAAAVGLGFWVPIMFFLGVLFGALWVTGDWLGRKIDRERAAAYAAYSAAPGESAG